MTLEARLDEVMDNNDRCSECKDSKYIKQIDMHVDEYSRPAYLITYNCGHQRSVPLIES